MKRAQDLRYNLADEVATDAWRRMVKLSATGPIPTASGQVLVWGEGGDTAVEPLLPGHVIEGHKVR